MIAPLVCMALIGQGTHPHSEATLVSSLKTAVAGKPFLVGISMKMDPTWHSYWLNPGDSGIPTSVDWTLPRGWAAGQIMWPTPTRIEMGGLVNYAYENSTVLLVRITPTKNAKPGEYKLQGNVKWLICQSGCLAASERVSKEVFIGQRPLPDEAWNSRLQSEEAALPIGDPSVQFQAQKSNGTIEIAVSGDGLSSDKVKKAVFFPADETIEPSAVQTVTERTLPDGKPGEVWTLKISEFAPAKIDRIKGLLVLPKGLTWGHGKDAIVVDTPVQSS